jgi:hypothetical protein
MLDIWGSHRLDAQCSNLLRSYAVLTGNNYQYFEIMFCFPIHELLGPESECTTFLRNISKYQSITFGITSKKVRILIED